MAKFSKDNQPVIYNGGRPKKPQELRDACREFTAPAINTLLQICQNQRASESSRVKAAETLLNRGWGPPLPRDDDDKQVTAEDLILALAHRKNESAD